ncbi:hypothetical protein [Neolewinella antarctica]|uniref:Uncharacterized protein n=1 Tax=Neolewinella antarctica TaxID=442734 RepID=A0ABX0XAF0_9BACT|nr:hypothetical protein [Neolewinella antarctica]NJC26231.1 hypothetical protein [Neolewinella antarctica]
MNFLKYFRRPARAVAGISTIGLTSCNRGFGCPTNFSLGDATAELLETLLTVVISCC